MELLIGDLAREVDVPVSTIRYYERIGLLTAVARNDGGYRLYTRQAVDEVRFIRRAQRLGFSLPEIQGLLALSRSGIAPCDEVVKLGQQHVTALNRKLEQLTRFRDHLHAAVQAWSGGECGFTTGGLCTLLDLTELPQPLNEPEIRCRGIARHLPLRT